MDPADVKGQRAAAKRKFTIKVRLFRECVQRKEPQKVLERVYEEVCQCFAKVDQQNEELIKMLDDEILIEECCTYILELDKIKCAVEGILISSKGENDSSNLKEGCSISGKLLVKKLDPPKFCGNVREFPTFMKDYTRLMIANHGKDPYVLRQSLTGKALASVSGLDDFDMMWDRLNERFGCVTKLIDSIIGEVSALKPVPEGNSKRLIEMINLVEQAWLDLKKLDKVEEIENSVTLAKIERLLPLNLKREWASKAQRVPDNGKFKEMIKFLTNERSIIEYMDDESRQGAYNKAVIHSVSQEHKSPPDELVSAIENLSRSQEMCQKQILDCFTNLSQAMKNMATSNVMSQEKIDPNYSYRRNSRLKECWFHNTNNHDILNCETFKRLENNTRLEHLRKLGICYLCLKGNNHISRNCDKGTPCDVVQGGQRCGRLHHPMIHSAFSFETPYVTGASNFVNRDGVLLMMRNINSGKHTVATLFDPGSNLTMITHVAAKKLGIKGYPVNLSITKIGNQTEQLDSKVYMVPLHDENGREWLIEACGIDEISSEVKQVDMSLIASVFGIHPWQIERPKGKLELLIGSDYCNLLPRVVKTEGNLQLMNSNFGYCVRGQSNQHSKNEIHVTVNHIACVKSDDLCVQPKDNLSKSVGDFFRVEGLGVSCFPRCGACRCGRCSLKGDMTLREERELQMIDQGLTYDSVNKCWIAEYPWIRNPKDLPNNISLAQARLKATERRLKNLGCEYSKKYQDQINDMVERGVARKLSPAEVLSYRDPVFYLPHHEVLKPGSSTPLRIVFDSSANYLGFSLNDFLCKGPDFLNNILGIMLRFCQREIGMVADIKKMYNSVKITKLDQNMHRFLWRDLQVDKEPDHYVLTAVTFGDKPGGAIAMAALRKTVDICNTYDDVSKLIVRNSYVDDLLISVNSYKESQNLMEHVDEVLPKGGFHIKQWVVSGVHDVMDLSSVMNQGVEKVLGIHWNPKEDYFFFKVNLNFSKRVRKCHVKPNLSLQDVDEGLPKELTKRKLLSQIASLYDPIGLITPFTLKGKLLMRDLVLEEPSSSKGNNWDIPVNVETFEKWKLFFQEIFELESLEFKRCLKPKEAVGNPWLVIFCDGSTKAYGAVAYIRWHLSDGSYVSKLITSKNKLAPTRQLSIPRIELCGAVLASRVRKFIEEEMEFNFDSVVHLTDSEIVRAQIQRDSFRFNTFVANRVAEIQTVSDPKDWYWVSSELNIADYTTRYRSPSQLGKDSIWQDGPEFLKLPFDAWPVTQINVVDIPDLLYATKAQVSCTSTELVSPIDVSSFHDYDKLINVTARVLNMAKGKSFSLLLKSPEAKDLEDAEIYWINLAQVSLIPDWETRFRRLGPKLTKEGMITVGSRISSWLKSNWNRNEYILLPAKHPFTRLYILYLHRKDHAGIETTLMKLQSKFWVPGARKIIKSIKANCVLCRKLNKSCETQCMGQLPEERLNPSPAFYNTALDLFGPFWVKDSVKRRTKMKVYGVIFNCLACRSVYLDIAEGYDSENFLKVFRRFVSIRGFPKVVYSDRGSQLIAANKELGGVGEDNLLKLTSFGRKEGMIWKFTKGADSPWQNGCSEALIKSAKRCIQIAVGENILSFGELQTVFFEIANVLNERPIGVKNGSDLDLGSYLCPNDLVLGRASIKVPSGIWEENCDLRKRFRFLNDVVGTFWRKWTRDYFPSLIVRSKWHCDRRNVRTGDIVIVQDKNALRGSWRLAQVSCTHPGEDGKVRNVSLRYKASQAGVKYEGQKDTVIQRSVNRMVVILPVEEQ